MQPTAEQPEPQMGRSSFTVQQSLSTLAQGFVPKTAGAIQSVFNSAQEIGNLLGRSAVTGVYLDQTGYLAFHNLYRFFLQYKKDVSGIKTKSGGTTEIDPTPRKQGIGAPLVFFNHKDNNEYSVVIKNFALRRDKENPMLYYYSISMRGYDLRDLKSTMNLDKTAASNQLLRSLGLDGIQGSSFMTDLKEAAALARDMLGSVATGVNQLGR
jgi:hypothetical protein